MFNRRLIPYLIVVSLIVLLSVCYMGYRKYQKHVEFETFMTKVQASLDKDTNPPERTEANPQGIDTNSSVTTFRRQSNTSHPIDTLGPPVQVGVVSAAEFRPIDESEMPPEILAKMKKVAASPMKPLRIQTPDGNIRIIYVPEGIEYKEGDIVLSKEMANSPAAPPLWAFEREESIRISDIPEGETGESYLEKMRWASLYGVSIEEVESMMERGHIPQGNIISRSPVEEFIDHDHLFHSHDHDNQPRSSGSVDGALLSGDHQAEAPVSDGGISEDTWRAPVPADVPRSPSNLSDMLEPSHHSITSGAETKTPSPPTAESIETQLREQLSAERLDKAQQFIDQYGTEEGLRRLRESDPEAAQQFERERLRSKTLQPSEPSP